MIVHGPDAAQEHAAKEQEVLEEQGFVSGVAKKLKHDDHSPGAREHNADVGHDIHGVGNAEYDSRIRKGMIAWILRDRLEREYPHDQG
jgi:hypothetical protein